jgi:hypothetical protein
LLSTPSHDDAVTFRYKLESVLLDKDFHLAVHVLLQAHWIPAYAGMTIFVAAHGRDMLE